MEKSKQEERKTMVSKEKKLVPKGRIVPMYLTDEGDVYPIHFHSMEELDLMQMIIAGFFEGKPVGVDFKTQINDPKYKFTLYDKSEKK